MADSARAMESPARNAELARIFRIQKEAFDRDRAPPAETRRERLEALIDSVTANEDRIVAAVSEDFGARARVETVVSEIALTIGAARCARKHLAHWMKPRRVATPLHMLPARSRVEPQPLGVVGIISPWNYPVQLALSPAAAALAAGNCVMLKPSETTPRTAALLKDMLAEAFDEDVLAIVVGSVETGEAFAALPFDHLMFTGSTAIGRKVAEAAAKNLTPVTLELGGKSPAIVDESADIAAAARSIAHGKMFNAGQTCVAPDFVLAPRDKIEPLVVAIASSARALYPDIDTTADYTSIVSDRHFTRLKAMVDEARDAGVRLVEVGSANALYPQRKLPLTIAIDPPSTLRMMREEIFGPVLPVLGVSSADDAVAHVNSGERPLALYWFGRDARARDKFLRETVSGGVTVNDTLWHVAQENLPFGGVGKSGMGAYHGKAGFDRFSHLKPVFYQSRFSSGGLLHPPYTEKTERALKLVRKIM